MKIKHLSTEFEYFTPKLLIFGPIKLEIIAYVFIWYIWTTTVQNFVPLYQQIWVLHLLFSNFLRFSTKFWLF